MCALTLRVDHAAADDAIEIGKRHAVALGELVPELLRRMTPGSIAAHRYGLPDQTRRTEG
jgi:hypothetical protein